MGAPVREDRVDQRESGREKDGTLAHGDVGHEMAGIGRDQLALHGRISVSGLSYPSITSARREGATGSGQHMSRTPVIAHARSQGGSPMCSHSAPPLIMRLHSAVSWPKSEARTEGEMIARGMASS